MMKKKILIIEDESRSGQSWANRLKAVKTVSAQFDVQPVDIDSITNAIRSLEERRQNARVHSKRSMRRSVPSPDGAKIIDGADILVVDYDLLNLEKGDLVGERVAYLARCFSRCGLIIGVNQFERERSVFDLTLRDHPTSFADLNIVYLDLDNEGLWGERWSGFRPWYWPMLPTAVEAFERRSTGLLDHLKDPIAQYLGLDGISPSLSRSVVEFIETEKKTLEETTFERFVIKSGNGLARRDAQDARLDSESLARIAAARLAVWLERLVVPGQDILIDAPHIVSRYPSLLKGERDDPASWNETISLKLQTVRGKPGILGIRADIIEAFRFKQADWISRPVWFWGQVSNSANIEEVVDPFKETKRPELVFCEDVSRFLPRDSAREFTADISGPFYRRYVVNQESKGGRAYAKKLKSVYYEPQVRFAF